MLAFLSVCSGPQREGEQSVAGEKRRREGSRDEGDEDPTAVKNSGKIATAALSCKLLRL